MKLRQFNLSNMTNKLILTNVIAFVLIWISISIFGDNKVLDFIALQPIAIISGQKLWTLITSMFAHFSFWHLFVNMLSFYFIGNFVEKLIGKKRILYLYLFAGLFAGLFWSVVASLLGTGIITMKIFGNPLIYGIGASGALFGFVGVLAVLTPKTKVYMIAGPIVAIIIQYTLMGILPKDSAILSVINILITIYFIVAITSMLSFNSKMKNIGLPIQMPMWILPFVAILPLIFIGLFIDLPIGNMAHLGGLLLGLLYAYILKRRYPKKAKLIAKKFVN